MYADIIVDISQEQLDKTFQYRIPPELENEVQIGVMVQIPFGRGNRLLTGMSSVSAVPPRFRLRK